VKIAMPNRLLVVLGSTHFCAYTCTLSTW